jgi:translation initiation factor 2 beta subunit (eIF-2beta)/eIF-5
MDIIVILLLLAVAIVLYALPNKCPKGGQHDDDDPKLITQSLYEFSCKKCGRTRRVIL